MSERSRKATGALELRNDERDDGRYRGSMTLFTFLLRNLRLVRSGIVVMAIVPGPFLRLVMFVLHKRGGNGRDSGQLPSTATIMRRAELALFLLRPSVNDLEVAGYMFGKLYALNPNSGLQFISHVFLNARKRERPFSAFDSSSSGFSSLVAEFSRGQDGEAARQQAVKLFNRLYRQYGLGNYRELAVLLAGRHSDIAGHFTDEKKTFLRPLSPDATIAQAYGCWNERVMLSQAEADREIVVLDPMDLAEGKAGETDSPFEYIPFCLLKRNSKAHQELSEGISREAQRLASIAADHLLLKGVLRTAFEIFLEKNCLYRTVLIHEKLEWIRTLSAKYSDHEFVALVREPIQYWIFSRYFSDINNIVFQPFGDFVLTSNASKLVEDLEKNMTGDRLHTSFAQTKKILAHFETLAADYGKLLEGEPHVRSGRLVEETAAGSLEREADVAVEDNEEGSGKEAAARSLEALFVTNGAEAPLTEKGAVKAVRKEQARQRYIDRIGHYFRNEEKAGNVLLQFNSKENLYLRDVESFLRFAEGWDSARICAYDQRGLLSKGFLTGFPFLQSTLRQMLSEGRLIAGYKNLPLPSFPSRTAAIYYIFFMARRKGIGIEGQPVLSDIVTLYFAMFLEADIKAVYSLFQRARNILTALSVEQVVSFPGRDIYQLPLVAIARHMRIPTLDIESCAFGELAYVPTHISNTVTTIDSIQGKLIEKYLKVDRKRILNTGCFNFSNYNQAMKVVKKPAKDGYVLVLTQDLLQPTEFFDFLDLIDRWHVETSKSVPVVIKPHPKETYRLDLYEARAAAMKSDVEVWPEVTLEEAISGALAVVVKSSNSGLQAMQQGKPMIVLPGDDATLDFLDYGYGDHVVTVADFDRVFTAAQKGEKPDYLVAYHAENPWIITEDTPKRILRAAGIQVANNDQS